MKMSMLVGFGLGAVTAAVAAKKLDGAAHSAKERSKRRSYGYSTDGVLSADT